MWLGFPSHADIWLDHYEAAQAALKAAEAARAALYKRHNYLSLSDRTLMSVFGA
jgi:hypothetical protein